MENIVEKWNELKRRILDSEICGEKYVLNFWEKEGIIKPYSKLLLGDTSCNFYIDRKLINPYNGKIVKHIHIQMKNLVYGI